MDTLTGRCIWVTGASSGMGRVLAKKLCELGNFVIASGRNGGALQQLVLSSNGRMCALPFDVTSGDEGAEVCRRKLSEITDYLDMVICSAGVCEYEDQLKFDPHMYRRVFEVNVLGVVNTLHLAMPLLKKSERAPQIAVLGSLSSVVPMPRAEAYGASKAAVEYLVRSLQVDATRTPLLVSLIRPGFVKTEMTANNNFSMPFMLTPDQAAERIIRGLRQRRRVIDFPRRLSWPLRLMAVCSVLWSRHIAPRMSRIEARDWFK